MKIETFTIEGRKPFKVMRVTGGFITRPSYSIITENQTAAINGTKCLESKKPTAYQYKKIYKYMNQNKRKGGSKG